jgi:hypothetical protein
MARVSTELLVVFCGEAYRVDPGRPFTIGREADLVLDSANIFLHRVFLRIEYEDGWWWIRNVGAKLSATVASDLGEIQAWLAPLGQLCLVSPQVGVWFTAGDVTYEFEITISGLPAPATIEMVEKGRKTVGAVIVLTPEQKLLVVALAEEILRYKNRGAGKIPSATQAADRLGWSLPKFRRKLDYLCTKLADAGVQGLHGGPARYAMSRRVRLVEYCVGTQMVQAHDLALLPAV